MFQWIEKLNHPIVENKLNWLSSIPLPIISWGCSTAANLLYFLTPGLRKKLIYHMGLLFPEWTDKQKKQSSRLYLHHVLISLFEITFLTNKLEKLADSIFQVEGEERLKQALKQGRGVIIHAPHVGNFLYYYWYLSQKYDCLSVATAESDILFMYKRFERLGCKGIDYDSTPPIKMLKELKTHLANNGVVLLFGDFYRPNFPEAEWFGRITKMPMGTIALAMEIRCPVVPFYGKQSKIFSHQLYFGEPVYLYLNYEKNERAKALFHLNALMEDMVRLAPEQWFYWFNAGERFKE